MGVRLIVISLASLNVFVFCSTSFAATPLAISELDADQKMAEADVNRARAERELSAWKLTQLKKLRSRGHASWQEVAEQEVTAKSLAADASASEQYLEGIVELRAKLMKSNIETPRESECVRLYSPQSARLLAWIPSDVASPDLLQRHLEQLRAEHQSLLEIELSPLEEAISEAEQAVAVYSRSEKDADLLDRASIRLQLANAEYALAKARRASAGVIARRMSLVRPSSREEWEPGIARIGTRFVNASHDRELAESVNAMAFDESTADERITWLEQRHDAVSARVDALQELSEHSRADPAEIEQTKQLKTELELEIQLAHNVLAVKQQIAADYQRDSQSGLTNDIEPGELIPVEYVAFADANTMRHWLQLRQLKFRNEANLAAIEAQRDYLAERLQRVQRIPENARPPKELDHLRHKLQGAEYQCAIVQHELSALECEQQRFCYQVKSQRGEQYQLVQADQGKFIGREQLERGTALIAVVGFVGQGKLFPERPDMFPYIESATIFDRVSQLSLQPPCGKWEIDSCPVWRSCHGLPRPSVQFCCEVPYVSSGLRLPLDEMIDAKNLFSCRPYGLWRVHPKERWPPWEYLQPASTRGYRSFNPYDNFPLGSCGRSVFSYRVSRPSRDSFPYRRDYLYRTAFPVRSNLYSYPYARSSGLIGNCFD